MPTFVLYERPEGGEKLNHQFYRWRTVESFEDARKAKQEYYDHVQAGKRAGKVRVVPFSADAAIPEEFVHEDVLNDVYRANRDLMPVPI